MGELYVVLLVYGLVQALSLFLLPGGWKGLAAVSLLAVIGIYDFFVHGGGYMGDVFLMIGLFYATAWLAGVWLLLGLVRLGQLGVRLYRSRAELPASPPQ